MYKIVKLKVEWHIKRLMRHNVGGHVKQKKESFATNP